MTSNHLKSNHSKSNHKRKTLRSQILMPYIVLIIVMSLVVLVGFNVAMRAYVRKVSSQQIQESRDTVIALLKKDLSELLVGQDATSETLATKKKR